MFVRLAFAVQAHLEPDILIVDEALSVGDQFFQAKCYASIRSMMDAGCTVLFVSHSAATVKALCPRAILLNTGDMIMDGPASRVLDRYFVLGSPKNNPLVSYSEATPRLIESVDENAITQNIHSQLQPRFDKRISQRIGTGQARFVECRVITKGVETTVLETRETAIIQAVLVVEKDCPYEGELGLVISTIEGIELFAINSFFQGIQVPALKRGKRHLVQFEFVCPLSSGARYRVDLGYRMPVQGEYVDKVFAAAGFSVMNRGEKIVPLLFDVPGRISIV